MLRPEFRHTPLLNMVDLSVPERGAMEVSGHRRGKALDRCPRVSPGDLSEGVRKLTGTFSGIMPQRLPADIHRSN